MIAIAIGIVTTIDIAIDIVIVIRRDFPNCGGVLKTLRDLSRDSRLVVYFAEVLRRHLPKTFASANDPSSFSSLAPRRLVEVKQVALRKGD